MAINHEPIIYMAINMAIYMAIYHTMFKVNSYAMLNNQIFPWLNLPSSGPAPIACAQAAKPTKRRGRHVLAECHQHLGQPRFVGQQGAMILGKQAGLADG